MKLGRGEVRWQRRSSSRQIVYSFGVPPPLHKAIPARSLRRDCHLRTANRCATSSDNRRRLHWRWASINPEISAISTRLIWRP